MLGVALPLVLGGAVDGEGAPDEIVGVTDDGEGATEDGRAHMAGCTSRGIA